MSRFALVACAVLGMASRAFAQPSAAAKPHVEAGVKAYETADYETAIREFEVAYGIDEDPVLLYAWAQAQRQGGHCDQAIPLYRRYIASKPNDDQIAAANTGIRLCEQQTPAPPPAQLPPVTLPPPPTEPVPSESPAPWYTDRLGGGLVIGSVASAAIGVTFLVLSNRSADAASEPGTRAEFLDHLDDATVRRRVGIVGLGLGAALVTAGIVRYASMRVTTDGSSVFVSGRF